MQRATERQINSTIFEEVKTARGGKSNLKEYIDSSAQGVADLKIVSATLQGDNSILVAFQPGRASVGEAEMAIAPGPTYTIAIPTISTTYYIYLGHDSLLHDYMAPPADTSQLLLLASVTVGATLNEITFADLRTILVKGGNPKEVIDARGGYSNLKARLDGADQDVDAVTSEVQSARSTYPSLNDRLANIGGGSGVTGQKTKLGVVGSVATPYVENITINETLDFMKPAVEVLKFAPGAANQLSTLCNFDNGDASSFNADSQVIFDGTMRLKTSYTPAVTDNGALGAGRMWTIPLNKSSFKTIESIAVS